MSDALREGVRGHSVAAAVLSGVGGSVYIDRCFFYFTLKKKKKNVPCELLTRLPHPETGSNYFHRARRLCPGLHESGS